MNNSIAISLSPNTDRTDVEEAFKILLSPWSWKSNTSINKVESWFQDRYGSGIALSFNSGRSALYALLKAFGIRKGDEVILQAFTCVAVCNAILWCGAKAVFADIDDSFNLDPISLEKKITSSTRAIIVQHTFGIPAQIKIISQLAKKHNLVLIEDCAHALGATVDNKLAGTFGDGAIFSFGRDKIISSVFGGLAIIKPNFETEIKNLKDFHGNLSYPSNRWIIQQLLHPIFFSIILPLYSFNIGKGILFILQKLHMLSMPIYKEEYIGGRPSIFPSKYPNALAAALLYQLSKLKRINDKRKEIGNLYYQSLKNIPKITLLKPISGAVFLRYPALCDKADIIISDAKKKKILLGNWYHHVIDPTGVDYKSIGYTLGSCPKAESVSKRIMNLPTHPKLSIRDINRVIDLIKKHYD